MYVWNVDHGMVVEPVEYLRVVPAPQVHAVSHLGHVASLLDHAASVAASLLDHAASVAASLLDRAASVAASPLDRAASVAASRCLSS